MRKQQQGFSLLVVLALGIVMSFVVLTFFKLVPVYSEYYAIKKTVDELAATTGKTDAELRQAFALRTTAQDIVSVKPEELVVLSSANAVGVGVSYRRQVPLIANVSLVFSFEHQAGVPVLKPNT